MKIQNLLLLGVLYSGSAQSFDFFKGEKKSKLQEVYIDCFSRIQNGQPHEGCIEKYSNLSKRLEIEPNERVKHLQTEVLKQARQKCKREISPQKYSCVDDLVTLASDFPNVDYRLRIRELQDFALGLSYDTCQWKIKERAFSDDERKTCIAEFERLSNAYEANKKGELNYLKVLYKDKR
ncbi:hypothetical protein J4467_02290 [Candidatus Woesearchaeota archaeon]|nr:hypothetical protein [Candidatus Woesearchaeota archaeon]